MRSHRLIVTAITALRLAATVPVVGSILSSRYALAYWILIAAFASDLIDGELARHWRVTSRAGASLDAAGDRLLVVATLTTFAITGDLPPYILLVAALVWPVDRLRRAPPWLSLVWFSVRYPPIAAVLWMRTRPEDHPAMALALTTVLIVGLVTNHHRVLTQAPSGTPPRSDPN